MRARPSILAVFCGPMATHFLDRMAIVENPEARSILGRGFLLEGGTFSVIRAVSLNAQNSQERGTQVSGMRGDLGYILSLPLPASPPGSEAGPHAVRVGEAESLLPEKEWLPPGHVVHQLDILPGARCRGLSPARPAWVAGRQKRRRAWSWAWRVSVIRNPHSILATGCGRWSLVRIAPAPTGHPLATH